MRTTLSIIIWMGALVLFFSSCNLLGEKEEKKENPAIPGKIVFSMPDDTENENNQLYVMNADGSDIRQLTSFEEHQAFQPSWSLDGEQIVFTSTMRSTSLGLAIHIMDANGENIRPMKLWPDSLHAYGGSNPTWSPDGTKIAFDWCQNCELQGKNTEIFIYDFETDSVEKITDHLAGDTHPSWSPDGQQLAFVSRRDYYDVDTLRFRGDLYKINIDGTSIQRLTETGYARNPQWHPDNSLIAYECNIRGNKAYLIDLDSKEIVEVESDLEFEASPQWSLEGTYLIIFGRQNDEAPTEIQFFHLENNQSSFAERIDDNPFLMKGRNFDWHYNENK